MCVSITVCTDRRKDTVLLQEQDDGDDYDTEWEGEREGRHSHALSYMYIHINTLVDMCTLTKTHTHARTHAHTHAQVSPPYEGQRGHDKPDVLNGFHQGLRSGHTAKQREQKRHKQLKWTEASPGETCGTDSGLGWAVPPLTLPY